MPVDLIDIFEIDENFPTANALLVPGPNQASYTIFIYKANDWFRGNQDTFFSLAQSGVRVDGTWFGVLDPISQTFSPITLPTVEPTGELVSPFTIVAISKTSKIVLAQQVFAPIIPGTVGQWLFNDPNQSNELLTVGF